MAINLQHSQTGLVKECPEGFSWTTFFFSGFVPLIRGMWVPFAITLFTSGLASIYYMFTINKLYAVSLLEKGYKPATDIDVDKLKMIGVVIGGENAKSVEAPTAQKEITEETVISARELHKAVSDFLGRVAPMKPFTEKRLEEPGELIVVKIDKFLNSIPSYNDE